MWFGEDDLLVEFDDILNDKPKSNSMCYHVWEEIGRSPVLDTPWINCKKCDMRKEDYDDEQKNKQTV